MSYQGLRHRRWLAAQEGVSCAQNRWVAIGSGPTELVEL